MQNILKPLLVILGLVALGAVVYVFLIKQPVEAPLTRTNTSGVTVPANESRTTVSDQVNVEEFQRLLNQLNGIRLNRDVFSRPQYGFLVDHTQTALQKLDETKAIAPLGKQNPFQGLDGGSPAIMLQGAPVNTVTPNRSR